MLKNADFAILKQSLILSSVVVFIYICGVCAMKMKESAPEIALDLFQNCDFPEELSEAFDAEVVLNDDAVGGSRYDTRLSA